MQGDLLSRLKEFLGGKPNGTGMAGVQLYGARDGQTYKPGEPVPFNLLMQEAKGWVYACIRVIAEELGMTPLELYQVTKSKDGLEYKPIDDSPMLDLLNAPNPYLTGFELFETISMHLDLTGNAFILMDGVKGPGDIPTALWPLPPDRIKPVRNALPDFIKSYIYRKDNVVREIQPHELLHIKEPNPNDLYMGLGAVAAAYDAVSQDNKAREWNRAFFDNGAWPSIMIKSNATNEDQLTVQLRSFVDRFTGIGKAHKVGILPKGVELDKTMSAMHKDMDFAELKTQMRDEILGLMRVPHVVLGLGAGESLNRATADMTDYVFARRTIRPKLRRIVSFLNEFFVPRFGEDLLLDFSDPVPEDRAEQRALHKDGLGGQPYLTVNEVRENLGMDDVPDGDTVNKLPGAQPLGTPDGDGSDPNAPKDDPPAKDTGKKRSKAFGGGGTGIRRVVTRSQPNRGWKNMQKRKEQTEDIKAKAIESAKKMLADAIKGHTADQRREFLEGTEKRAVEGRREVKAAMDGYHAKLAKRLSDHLGVITEKGLLKKETVRDVIDRNKEISDIVDALSPVMEQLAITQAIAAAEYVGATFDSDEAFKTALGKSVKRMAGRYTTETLAQLDKTIGDGIDAGEGIDGLAKRVQEFEEWSDDVRSTRVAQTETMRTLNLAGRAAWKASGVVKTLVWHVQSNNPCEFCAGMDGQEVGIDDPFYEKGDTLTGADGGEIDIDYADGYEPNVHPHCECKVLPGQISVSDDSEE